MNILHRKPLIMVCYHCLIVNVKRSRTLNTTSLKCYRRVPTLRCYAFLYEVELKKIPWLSKQCVRYLSSITQCFEIERTFSKEDMKYLEKMNVVQAKTWFGWRRDLHDLPHQSLVMCSVWKKSLINPEASVKRIMYSQVSNK